MFYHVKKRLKDIPREFYEWGYEDEHTFLSSLYALHAVWKGWTGRCVEERHRFRRLRFRNIYGGYEEAWLPDFMLETAAEPTEQKKKDEADPEEWLNEVFGLAD